MPDWDENSPALRANLVSLLRDLRDRARDRATPGLAEVRRWHRQMMDGLQPPNPAWVGVFRGEAGAEAVKVRVGAASGLPAPEVEAALDQFFQMLNKLVAHLDRKIPAGSLPRDEDALEAVLEACAWVHAEWVRIHPFANGNGRTARFWANYIAMRYGLPPFIRLRPRPDNGCGRAAANAMSGNWQATIPVFRRFLADFSGE